MRKILYLEDDPFLAGAIKTKLELDGVAVAHYPTPAPDPVALALREKPQLILMDIIMPGMDGYAATKLLKGDKRTREIPIFGLSNLGQQDDIDKAYALGMTCYWVTADHTFSDVVQKVRELLAQVPQSGSRQ